MKQTTEEVIKNKEQAKRSLVRKRNFQVPNLTDDSSANMTLPFTLPFGASLCKEIQMRLAKFFIPFMKKTLFSSGISLTLAK